MGSRKVTCTARRSRMVVTRGCRGEGNGETLVKGKDWAICWKDWCWSWSSNTLATGCEELTHWKRPWCWERLRAGGEGEDRGWGGWMASPTQWTWVWVNSRSWWWTGRPGVLRFMGSQRVGHDWVTELSWSKGTKLPLHRMTKFWRPNVQRDD